MPLGLIALYFVLSLLVGYLGRGRSIGFAGYFVLSLLLSPLVMALALLVNLPRHPA
ncbi:MAG: hypothetical protein HOB08_00010 [Rhodospirillaceae bacterium]|mgnify:FL=1|jgi:hypothetical protein|nr:hypothetical protein [Verrucomicrobiota bacterium]MBT4564450.1 hypothetical protein [Rhodospirillaceae bacterium]MBT6675472.1 hypothetical protein [Rhodospirillaceae bacterium]